MAGALCSQQLHCHPQDWKFSKRKFRRPLRSTRLLRSVFINPLACLTLHTQRSSAHCTWGFSLPADRPGGTAYLHTSHHLGLTGENSLPGYAPARLRHHVDLAVVRSPQPPSPASPDGFRFTYRYFFEIPSGRSEMIAASVGKSGAAPRLSADRSFFTTEFSDRHARIPPPA